MFKLVFELKHRTQQKSTCIARTCFSSVNAHHMSFWPHYAILNTGWCTESCHSYNNLATRCAKFSQNEKNTLSLSPLLPSQLSSIIVNYQNQSQRWWVDMRFLIKCRSNAWLAPYVQVVSTRVVCMDVTQQQCVAATMAVFQFICRILYCIFSN